jgi:hypothetical protein
MHIYTHDMIRVNGVRMGYAAYLAYMSTGSDTLHGTHAHTQMSEDELLH